MSDGQAVGAGARWSDRARRLWGRVSGRPPTVVIRSGAARGLWIDLHDASGDYGSGANERPVQDALVGVLGPGRVFYDVGANIGFFTLIAARAVGSRGHVGAFEPAPHLAARLRRNVSLNRFDNVTVLEAAAGDAERDAVLHLSSHPGGATLVADAPGPAVGTRTVAMVTLDGVVARGDLPPPDVVKIDVEGYEAEVIRGMSDTLEAHRPVVVYEVDGPDRPALDARAATVAAALERHGYVIEPLAPSYPEFDWQVLHAVARPEGG